MDLEPGWEKKALIIVAVVTVILVVYAYGPFNGNARAEVINNTSETPVTEPAPVPAPQVPTFNNSTSSNITSVNVTGGNNGTYQVTADQAKKIASQPNFTAGEPTKGNIMINNNNTAVWIVPLMKGTVIFKRIYVDAATGIIVGSEEVKN